MRIQHNIAALNSYRNLTTNNSAVSKNLEKLSSGYRINRAGDDAAGLAISEKMRAQITGLKTAQKNANDGISLVQTAEGAMTEVHSMLNRMVELADQSANGTYADEVDRENLQKEVASLKDEINRIADSTNFNGINLLDGSLDSTGKEVVKDPTIVGQKAIATGYGNRTVGSGGTTDGTGAVLPQYHKEATGDSKTSFTIGFNDATVTSDGNAQNMKLALADKDWNTITGIFDFSLSGKAEGQKYDKSDLAKALYNGLEDGDNGKKVLHLDVVNPKTDEAATDDSIEYEATLNDDGTVTFTMTDDGYKKAVELAKSNTAPAKDAFEGNFSLGVDDDAALAQFDAGSARNIGTMNINVGGPSAGKQLAQTYVMLGDIFSGTDGGAGDDASNANITIADGSGLKVGDTYYAFATTDETANGKFGDNVKIIDIRDLMDVDGKTLKNQATDEHAASTLNEAISRLTQAAADNEMFSVEYAKDGGNAILLSEKDTYSGDADLTKFAGIRDNIQVFSAIQANVEKIGGTGSDLTLQIGDTSDDFNQLTVNVSDMHASAMGIGDVDISTQAGAAKAVAAIKDAINYVSSTRGDLGAIQNRLEHTINNLSVATENITAAESRIRDVDMAEEMMAYTKNNILVQASQAMLAQANQIPQGVLQLLQ